jgi:hypothetical protein
MSDSNGISMEQFNINELAGATGLILGAVSGILVVIFKSRCYCKFRIGISDKYNLCMCERKPPPDPQDEDSEEETNKTTDTDTKEEKLVPKKVDRNSRELEPEPEPEIEKLV